MSKFLKVQPTKSSMRRKPMGSKSNSYNCQDAAAYGRVAVLHLDKELEYTPKFYDVYESHISFSLAGFIFKWVIIWTAIWFTKLVFMTHFTMIF